MKKQKILHEAVVCYLFDEKGRILLSFKPEEDKNKRLIKIGEGFWNGYGGGVESSDISPERAVMREVVEETSGGVGISPVGLKKVAEITFHNHMDDGNVFSCLVHFFFSHRWFGEPKPSKEMITPTFFETNKLPKKIMPADRHFLPILLRGDLLKAEYCYSPFQQHLIGKPELSFVNSF